MMNTIKADGFKALEACYGAIVASTLAFGGLMILLGLIAMAVDVKAIDVQHIHTAPQF